LIYRGNNRHFAEKRIAARAASREKSTMTTPTIRRALPRHGPCQTRQEADLLRAIESCTLGRGSVAGGEYLRNMTDARLCEDGAAKWVEVCFCAEPLAEERPYWEEFFELVRVQDAHSRRKCRDETGEEPWACGDCDCTEKLERHLADAGSRFLDALRLTTS
jgi:hypothetical protein